MARKSRVKALASLLEDQKALQQIGSKIVRAALAQSARVGNLKPVNLGDPDWPDSWSDVEAPPWDNAWVDDGGSNPHWSEHNDPGPGAPKGWDRGWDNGTGFIDVESIGSIASRVQPIFEKTLTAEEKNILIKLNIVSATRE